MARAGLVLIIAVAALAAVLSFIGTFLPHQAMMGGMGGMMGFGQGSSGSGGMGMVFWPSTLTASAAVLIVVIGYLVAFPTIRYTQPAAEPKEQAQATPSAVAAAGTNADPLDVVMRVLKPDEKAALEVLRNGGGICLQKDITYKAGLSKLKTHRVVARLAERGVIQVRKVGKTNEITVPAWLKPNSNSKS